MKGLLQLLWIVPLTILTSGSAWAQVSTSGIKIDTANCESSNRYSTKLKKQLCYSVANYPTIEEATARHTEVLLMAVQCGECDIPTVFSCTASVDNIAVGDLELNAAGDRWCSGRQITFDWSCSACIDTIPPDTINPLPIGLFGTPQENSSGLLEDKNQNVNRNASPVESQYLTNTEWKIYPNPTSGGVEIEAYITETVEELHLVAFDISGKKVFQKDYGASTQGQFRSVADLSHLANGGYLLSFYMDGKLVGTKKVAINK